MIYLMKYYILVGKSHNSNRTTGCGTSSVTPYYVHIYIFEGDRRSSAPGAIKFILEKFCCSCVIFKKYIRLIRNCLWPAVQTILDSLCFLSSLKVDT